MAEYIGNDLLVDDRIALYYTAGYTINEIRGFLAVQHGRALSERQIHYILRRQNLQRRNNNSDPEEIVRAILHELSGPGQNAGYRQMRQRLLANHDVNASRELVRVALRVIDPVRVMNRRAHRLQRRIYTNKGPNFCIHIDGWDKLKPFGISVHGAVDGFSRRVLWLKACESNKNPHYIAKFYFDYIRQINGVPVRVFADRGTENSIVRDTQYALRWNDLDQFQGLSSFIYVSSNRNVRIERFWRSLREMTGQFWINLFKDMCDLGLFDTSDNAHMECARYCFIDLINKELDNVRRLWNEHRVRANIEVDCPAGKPDVLFFQPMLHGGREYKLPVPDGFEEVASQYSQCPRTNGVSEEFLTLAAHIIEHNNLQFPPSNAMEASELFAQITHVFSQI